MRHDNLSIEQRRRAMQAVKASGSKIEVILGKALWRTGLRYRKNYARVFGKPDIVFVSKKVAVFCDSEFWHGYKWRTKKHEIKTNTDFWWSKIERNIARDKLVTKRLREADWIVFRFWGHEILDDLEGCVDQVYQAICARQNPPRIKL